LIVASMVTRWAELAWSRLAGGAYTVLSDGDAPNYLLLCRDRDP
jgi:hypothetical protein